MNRITKIGAILILVSVVLSTSAQDNKDVCSGRKIPQLTDVLAKTGIKFVHTSAPEKKYIVESMSGGVLMIDFDQDGWLDL